MNLTAFVDPVDAGGERLQLDNVKRAVNDGAGEKQVLEQSVEAMKYNSLGQVSRALNEVGDRPTMLGIALATCFVVGKSG